MNDYRMTIIDEYEKKLIELMGKDEYYKFAVEVSRIAFKKEIQGMEDCGFKDFVMENFDEIVEV